MIKLKIQLFGGTAGDSAETTNVAGLIMADPGQSIIIGKAPNSIPSATSVRNKSEAYLQGLGLSLNTEGTKIDNISDAYRNTYHVVKAEDDDEKDMQYVMYIGNDGSVRISAPGYSSQTAGAYLANDVWDQLYGKANSSVRNKSEAYLQGLGLSLNTEGTKINNVSDTYSNTFHLIKAKGDDEKDMYYVMHIGNDGSVRISEPGHSSQILNQINKDYTKGNIIADPKGYYKNAEIINGSIDWQGKSKILGTDAEGNKVFNDGNGGVITSTGDIVTSYTDNNGTLITGKVGADGVISSWTDASGNDVTIPDVTASRTPVQNAYNMYYNDLYSREEGTLGRDILDNNTSLFEKEAQNAAMLADTSMQAQAIQQAQAVKQVTDSVRSERAAQLRAGMSESQLADRELQMLMGSVNQMSAQAQMASQEATAAQLGQSTARENAFNQYIEQTTTLGQNASANYASHVGDANAQAEELRRKMAAVGIQITPEQAFLITTGQTPNKAT